MSEAQLVENELHQNEDESGIPAPELEMVPEESKSESAPDIPAGEEKPTELTSEQKAQQAINKQHFKFREEERKRKAIEEEVNRLKEQLASKGKSAEVTVPAMPDSWDENYDQLVRERDEAIQQKARTDAIKQQDADNAAIAERQRQNEAAENVRKLNDSFIDKAGKLGIDKEDLGRAQTTVIEYGVTPEIAGALLSDSNGPLMVQYLSANPLELNELVNAQSPVLAGMMLSEIRAKSEALKPQTTSTPAPADTLSGKGAPSNERGPKGAIYE
jgi:hypothetical protein